MRRVIATTLCLVALLLAYLTPAAALQPRIVNGLLTHAFPTTGVLLSSNNPASAGTSCSGTMIGCETFLTAGHCVENNLNPSSHLVFLQHAGFFTVTSVALHPDYVFPPADVAVLKLGAAVDGISPTPIDTVGGHASGTVGTIAGFGRSGGSNFDYGLKRFGNVEVAACGFGVSNTTSICWNYENPIGPPGDDSNTCNADSGGPLFINPGGGDVVAGITSGGLNSNCLAGDNSFDARVSFYTTFIQDEGGADLSNTTCGTLPQVGDSDATVHGFSGTVSSGTPQGSHSFIVAPGTPELRVTMNSVDDGSDFDLYVKRGSPPTTTDFDCAQSGSGQYGSCIFGSPTAGTWYVLVNRFSGDGIYQVTATTFGSFCGDAGNDGMPCDDGDPCTDPDTCQSLMCAGTALSGPSCDDGNACTSGDTCTLGTCVGSEAPEPVCSDSLRGSLQLRDRFPDTRDSMNFRWQKGAATTVGDFGDPVNGSTSYDLCVYDESGDVPSLVMSATIPAGGSCRGRPCWKTSGTGAVNGYRYNDRDASNAGIRRIVLRPGVQDKARVQVKGKGANLALPGLPLTQDSHVTIQLRNDVGRCWGTAYDAPAAINDGDRFKDKHSVP